jgi:Arc/MetJ family transcription regulator
MTIPNQGRAGRPLRPRRASGGGVFAAVLDARPYPEPRLTHREWAHIPPRQVRLADLTTTRTELRLDRLLAEDSTFYGDLFCHVVDWEGALYLEDGLHRAVQAALQQRTMLHVRVARLDADGALRS